MRCDAMRCDAMRDVRPCNVMRDVMPCAVLRCVLQSMHAIAQGVFSWARTGLSHLTLPPCDPLAPFFFLLSCRRRRANIYDHDNEPMVLRRDGSYSPIDKHRGFLNYQRNPEPYRDPLERVTDWGELNPTNENVDIKHNPVEQKIQAARCMDCGTPFCSTHSGEFLALGCVLCFGSAVCCRLKA